MRKLINRYMPDTKAIKDNKFLKIFGSLLHSPSLWHLNRTSVAKAFAVGLFIAFIPIPFQMVVAAGVAILFNANLPLSVALVWLSNPITIPFIFYACYKTGELFMGNDNKLIFEANLQWIIDSFEVIGPPFLLGCLVLGSVFSLLGYVTVHSAWYYNTKRAWNNRKARKSR
jgi:uncharacterized protein (DUF2062 family)